MAALVEGDFPELTSLALTEDGEDGTSWSDWEEGLTEAALTELSDWDGLGQLQMSSVDRSDVYSYMVVALQIRLPLRGIRCRGNQGTQRRQETLGNLLFAQHISQQKDEIV